MGIVVQLELDDALEEHVRELTNGEHGYVSIKDYIEDLIRWDLTDQVDNAERELEVGKALSAAFSEPESALIDVNVNDFLAEMKSRAA